MLKKITVVSLWFFLLTGGVYADKTNANPSFVSGGQDYSISYATDDGYATLVTVERLVGTKVAKIWNVVLAQNSKVHVSADFFSKNDDAIVLEWEDKEGNVLYAICRFVDGNFMPQTPIRKIEWGGVLLVEKKNVVEWGETHVRSVSWNKKKNSVVTGAVPPIPFYKTSRGVIVEYEISEGKIKVLHEDLLAGFELRCRTQCLVFMRRDNSPLKVQIEVKGVDWLFGSMPNSFVPDSPGKGEVWIIPNDNQMAAVRFPVTAK